MKLVTAILIFITLLTSCNDEQLTQEQEAKRLEVLFNEIESLASRVGCVSPSEWTYTTYGSKACGGPVGFIAYSIQIDTKLFLQKVEWHRSEQKAFNEKWGTISDCSFPSQPIGLICENGNPRFTY